MKNLFLLFAMLYACATFAQRPMNVNMNPANDWDSYLVPGIGYGAFMPRDWKTVGFFHGLNTEFTFYTVNRPAYKGPGFFRFYGRFNLMQSVDAPKTGLFTYGIGSNLSFEREIKRKAMIPYFGLEIGGMNRSDLGGAFQLTPLLGINLISTKNFTWYLQGGYTYAASRNFYSMSGGFANTGVAVMFW